MDSEYVEMKGSVFEMSVVSFRRYPEHQSIWYRKVSQLKRQELHSLDSKIISANRDSQSVVFNTGPQLVKFPIDVSFWSNFEPVEIS